MIFYNQDFNRHCWGMLHNGAEARYSNGKLTVNRNDNADQRVFAMG